MSESQKADKKKRTAKGPLESARSNARGAITHLESLGGRLFKIDRGDLIDNLREALTSARALHDALHGEPLPKG